MRQERADTRQPPDVEVVIEDGLIVEHGALVMQPEFLGSGEVLSQLKRWFERVRSRVEGPHSIALHGLEVGSLVGVDRPEAAGWAALSGSIEEAGLHSPGDTLEDIHDIALNQNVAVEI